MHGDRRFSLLAVVVLVLSQAACLNVISGDDEWVDEFSRFKLSGGQCVENAVPLEVDVDLAGATRYRWLGYGGVLSETVSDDGQVYYDELLEDPELSAQLRGAITDLASLQPTQLGDHWDKLAFWMNAYNALVLLAAAQAYSEDPAFRVDVNSFAFFDQQVHNIGGRLFSLNQIEHGVLRGTALHPATAFLDEEDQAFLFGLSDDLWGEEPFDPRFHFAINCASSSCPELIQRQFFGATVDMTLQAMTGEFLFDDAKGAGPNGISQLFDFYFDDFETVGGTEAFIASYRPIDQVNLFSYLPYDWSLNRTERTTEE